METAIYIYQPGKEKEVKASKFKEKKNYKKGDFICPECGEAVMLRMSLKQKNYFAHFKNEITIDCDRRANSNITMNIYERLGVPLYLTYSYEKGYALNIGLKSINQNELIEAEQNKAFFEIIINKKNKKKIKIDKENFKANQLNLFQINNYSAFDRPFLIRYVHLPNGINKWADYIEPITQDGIIFSINSNIGKSIRHGDTIYADEEYLWLSPKELTGKNILEKNVALDGDMLLNKRKHYIYKVKFIENKNDFKNFKLISEEVHNKLKLVLLDSKNEINLIWPPGIRTEEGYSVFTKGRVHSIVHSGSENPDIYEYSSDGYIVPKKLDLHHNKKKNYLCFNLKSSEVQLNMNRRLTSTGTEIKHDDISYQGIERQFVSHDRKVVETTSIRKSSNLDLFMETNTKIKTIKLDNRKRVEIQNYEDGKVVSSDLTYGDHLLLFNYDYLIAKIEFEKAKESVGYSARELMILSKTPQNKRLLTANNRHTINQLIEIDQNYLTVFNPILRENKVPYLIQNILEEIFKNERL